jgi:predicted Na+-dependent transporter
VIAEAMRFAFKLSLIVFMVGNLSSMGLQLNLRDALTPLKNARFLVVTLVASFVFSPATAYLVTRLLPMDQPYALGLLLLGFAPAAPFLPLVVRKGQGDLSAAAALMLLASTGTILIMPLALTHIAPALTTNTWTIARPLVFLVFVPLSIGMALRAQLPRFADYIYVYDQKITTVGTVLFLSIVLVMNFRSFLGLIGSYALAAQLLFVGALTVGGYLMAMVLPYTQRIVVSLGVCTRNIGVAAAIVGPQGDQRVMVMLVIGAIVTVVISFAAAACFARWSPAFVTSQASHKSLIKSVGSD